MDTCKSHVTYLKSLVHLSKVCMLMNISVPQNKKSFVMLSHVVYITVHTISITWCKLWQQFGWQLLYWNAEGYTFLYTIQCINFKSKKCTHYCTWDIDWLHPSSCLSHCMAKIDNMVQNSGPYSILYALICPWPLPSVCLWNLSPCILTPLLLLGCWPWSFSGCSSIVRMYNSFVVSCLYMLSHWRFMRCTFELFQRTGLSLIDLLFISENQYSPEWKLFMMCKVTRWCRVFSPKVFLHSFTDGVLVPCRWCLWLA